MIETLVAAAGKLISDTEGAKTAKKELSSAIWAWIRPIFLKDDPEAGEKALTQVKAAPSAPESQELVKSKLTDYLSANPEAVKQLQELLVSGNGGVYNFGDVKNQLNNPTFNKDVTFN